MSITDSAPLTSSFPNSQLQPGTGLARPGTPTLAVMLAGAFMVVLDFFIVMVALPSIAAGLSATGAQLQLVVTAYSVATAVGLITGGRLGDRFGRRRMFSLGLLLFTVASALCALAPTPSMLIAARIAQGLAGALLQPQVLAMLGVAYRGRARTRAFAAYAITMGAGGVIGQLIGGAVLQADLGDMGWRACFLVNLPIGLAALLLTPRVVPELRRRPQGRLDLAGMALVALLLAALVLPLVEGRHQGWPLWSFALLGAAPLLGVLLNGQQRRLAQRGGQPLLAPALMRHLPFSTGLLATLLFSAGTTSYYFVLALYLQQGLGLSALGGGAMLSVMGAGFFASSLLAPRLDAWFGGAHLQAGALLLVLAHALQASLALAPGLHHWSLMLPLLLAQGAGLGMVMGPLASQALAGLPHHHYGLASGLLATGQQVGNSIGVALIGLLYYGIGADRAAPASASAFAASLAYLATLALALAVLLGARRALLMRA